jgi:hypothetical protein
MKASAFKQLIEDSVRKVIQEELREILLEAVKAPRQTIVKEVINEANASNMTAPTNNNVKKFDPMEMKSKYMGLLDGMKEQMSQGTVTLTTNDLQMTGPVDNVNGSLINGDLPLDMIAGLMNKK